MAKQNYLGEFEELVLLAIMKIGKDAYSVPIAEAIEDATGENVGGGALFVTLSRLEDKGFISSKLGEASKMRGGRAKRYYTVEGIGKQALTNSENARRSLKVIDVPEFN